MAKHTNLNRILPGSSVDYTPFGEVALGQVEVVFSSDKGDTTDYLDGDFDKEDEGRIEVKLVNPGDNEQTVYARPLTLHQVHRPIVGENVLCFKLPITTIGDDPTMEWFYLCTVAVSSNINNQFAEDEDPGGPDGEVITFEKNDEILPLQTYEGDILYEGRFGQSIRFGSTNPGSTNDWSLDGASGDPIIIIKNGVSEPLNDFTSVESLANDASSITLTAGQSLPVAPTPSLPDTISDAPDTFAGNQVVINSDRLFFNARENDVIISSGKSIALATPEWKVDVSTMMDLVERIATELDALCTGQATLTTGVGPTGPGTNAGNTTSIVTEIGQLKG